LAQKIINPDFLGGVGRFLMFLTSSSPSITTPTIKKEYKLEPWGEGKTNREMHPYAGIFIVVLQFPVSPCI
jgi:hypothetical protein